jgi:hypothetical protein
MGETPSGRAGLAGAGARVEALSAQSYRVEFTASAELHAKLERAQALLSHAVAPGALAEIFERALDALVEAQTKRRDGVARGKSRKRRSLKAHSRHVPVEVARAVWRRDGERCTFVDAEGRRCGETRFLTLEHRDPFARGGEPSVENLCVLCEPHNQQAARREFGAGFVLRKQREAEAYAKVGRALVAQGFRRKEVRAALAELRERSAVESNGDAGDGAEVEALLRQALGLLGGAASGVRTLSCGRGRLRQ